MALNRERDKTADSQNRTKSAISKNENRRFC